MDCSSIDRLTSHRAFSCHAIKLIAVMRLHCNSLVYTYNRMLYCSAIPCVIPTAEKIYCHFYNWNLSIDSPSRRIEAKECTLRHARKWIVEATLREKGPSRFCFRSSFDSGRLIAIDGRIKRRTMRLAALKLDWKPPSSPTFYNDNRPRLLCAFPGHICAAHPN